jgi:GT2 family glycosyltransferase
MYDVPESGTSIPTEFVTGCAMTISRELVHRIGTLPECYFPGYSEDAEYSRRARENGFQVLYAPKAVAYHKVGATAGHAKSSPRVLQIQVRHRVFYVRRSFHGLERFIALGYLAVTKPAKALLEVIAGRPRMAMAVLRGTVEGFTTPV